VTGTVTHKGKPLPGGIVTFVHPDGRIGQAQINEDGSYHVPNAPGGKVRVTVKTVPPIPGFPSILAPKGMKFDSSSQAIYPAGKYVKIAAKYGDPETSGFELDVKRSNQPFNLDLGE
jgi:hypothetical protein